MSKTLANDSRLLRKNYLSAIQTASAILRQITKILLLLADKRATVAERAIQSELCVCANFESRLSTHLTQALIDLEGMNFSKPRAAWSRPLGERGYAHKAGFNGKTYLPLCRRKYTIRRGSALFDETYRFSEYEKLKEINRKLNKELKAFLKAAAYDLNYLEQYFEHDFWLVFEESRYAEQLNALCQTR